jgi:hypothetical protein
MSHTAILDGLGGILLTTISRRNPQSEIYSSRNTVRMTRPNSLKAEAGDSTAVTSLSTGIEKANRSRQVIPVGVLTTQSQ